MDVHNKEMLEVMELLEHIVVDEMLITGLSDDSGTFEVYRKFLQRVKYEYRWFGVRTKAEFVSKWNDLRTEFVLEDSDFKDTSPSVQISLLTSITQRMMLATEEELWIEDSWLCEHIANVIHVYGVDSNASANVMYDTQITTTVSRDDIIKILGENKWLIVVILMSWMSNRCVLEALGHLTYDNPN